MYTLRPYHKGDYQQVIKLFLLNTPEYFCPPEQEDLERYLSVEIENFFVIEDEDEVVATGGSNIKGDIGYLSWYIVHPGYHGKGYGKLLAQKNLDILKSNPKLNGIKVRTSQLVYPFYEKMGFVLISTTDNYWGEGMHLYEMQLQSTK
ncbi:MAG: GNAT family N-acetyltransferase [Bacteroidetes bacterium]|nr:GNAT family N-acetyltransferase [Bacteroidota bacterium]